jgi:hypothetical protein
MKRKKPSPNILRRRPELGGLIIDDASYADIQKWAATPNAHLVPDGECRCECPSCEMDGLHHGPGEGNCQKAYVPK